MEIAHKTNTLDSFFKHYYEYNCRNFEIDIQLYKNSLDNSDEIIVYHDNILTDKDFTKKKDVVSLFDFLRLIPDDIILNIEIKDYSGSNKYYKSIEKFTCSCNICTQNNLNKTCFSQKRELIEILLVHLKYNKKKKIIISSFDMFICNNKDIIYKLKSITNEIIFIIGELENYDKNYKKICIHKKFLDFLNYNNHELIYVYDVHKDNLDQLKINYPLINGWILDY
jgi:glycerophosphoryl diester phosphodiesterase